MEPAKARQRRKHARPAEIIDAALGYHAIGMACTDEAARSSEVLADIAREIGRKTAETAFEENVGSG